MSILFGAVAEVVEQKARKVQDMTTHNGCGKITVSDLQKKLDDLKKPIQFEEEFSMFNLEHTTHSLTFEKQITEALNRC